MTRRERGDGGMLAGSWNFADFSRFVGSCHWMGVRAGQEVGIPSPAGSKEEASAPPTRERKAFLPTETCSVSLTRVLELTWISVWRRLGRHADSCASLEGTSLQPLERRRLRGVRKKRGRRRSHRRHPRRRLTPCRTARE
eukprot:765767-Hanusia_phi.AAC.2